MCVKGGRKPHGMDEKEAASLLCERKSGAAATSGVYSMQLLHSTVSDKHMKHLEPELERPADHGGLIFCKLRRGARASSNVWWQRETICNRRRWRDEFRNSASSVLPMLRLLLF